MQQGNQHTAISAVWTTVSTGRESVRRIRFGSVTIEYLLKPGTEVHGHIVYYGLNNYQGVRPIPTRSLTSWITLSLILYERIVYVFYSNDHAIYEDHAMVIRHRQCNKGTLRIIILTQTQSNAKCQSNVTNHKSCKLWSKPKTNLLKRWST